MNRLLALAAALCLSVTPCLANRTLTDETGRTVSVPEHPHRIVCLVPSVTDAVFALGAADDVVAVSDFVKYPEAATKKPTVGSILNPSMEVILSLHPDLLLGMPHQNQQGVLDQFARLGIPLYLVDPHGVPGILKSVSSLGQAIGREQEAAVVVFRLRQRIEAVKEHTKGKPAISVFFPVSYDPVITIGQGAFIADIIDIAGGHSITSDIRQEWPHVSLESVIARDPQALLMMRGGKITLETLKTRPGWQTLSAIKAERVYFIDKRIELPSPIAIDALEDLAKQFHP